jgi:hypothetical protein
MSANEVTERKTSIAIMNLLQDTLHYAPAHILVDLTNIVATRINRERLLTQQAITKAWRQKTVDPRLLAEAAVVLADPCVAPVPPMVAQAIAAVPEEAA